MNNFHKTIYFYLVELLRMGDNLFMKTQKWNSYSESPLIGPLCDVIIIIE